MAVLLPDITPMIPRRPLQRGIRALLPICMPHGPRKTDRLMLIHWSTRWLWAMPVVLGVVLALMAHQSTSSMQRDASATGGFEEAQVFLTGLETAVAAAQSDGDTMLLQLITAASSVEPPGRREAISALIGLDGYEEALAAAENVSLTATAYAAGEATAEEYEASTSQFLYTIGGLQQALIDRRDGTISELNWIVLSMATILAVGGVVAGIVQHHADHLVGRTRSQLTSKNETLTRTVREDSLTGALSRAAFFEELQLQLVHAHSAGARVAVVFADIDRFKYINDLRGHEAGDQLLRDVAKRLMAAWPQPTSVARLGGDEFGMFTTLMADTDPLSLLTDLHQALAAITEDGGDRFTPALSLGMSVSPDHGTDAQSLTHHADLAMYDAKRRDGEGFRVVGERLAHSATARSALEANLRMGLAASEFELHYQPIVDTTDGHVHRVEALLRWCHPETGLLGPGDFIAVAEESGLIVPLGNWVLEEAVRQAHRWLDEGITIPIAINVSPRQLVAPGLSDSLAALLADGRVPADQLIFEITESAAMVESPAAEPELARVRALGVSIALDDFGAGYSSMQRVQQLQIDCLKIDRSFVRDIATSETKRAIVESTVALAGRLGLEVVAEGVETAEELREMQRIGCGLVQGYLIRRPAPPAELGELLRAGSLDGTVLQRLVA